MRKHLLGKRKTGGGRNGAFGLDFGQHGTVIGGINNHGHRLMILRRRTDHRRTADVDVFNGVLKRAVGLGDRLFERIKIHADDVDRVNGMSLKRSHVFRDGTTGENAGMNLGIERLNATVQHLRETRIVGDFLAGHAFLHQQLGGTSRAENVVAERREFAGEVNHAGFIGHADKSLFAHCFFLKE